MSRLVGRVIVGVHGTAGSLQALRFAVGQATALGATLIPVIAWEPPGGDSAGRHYPPFLTDEWAQAAESRLLTAFAEALGGLPEDLPAEPMVVRGRAGPVLVSLADRENDLLVLGRSRRRLLHRSYYGCAPRYCQTHATCAVVVVPPSRLAQELARSRRSLPHRRGALLEQVNPLGEPRAHPGQMRATVRPVSAEGREQSRGVTVCAQSAGSLVLC